LDRALREVRRVLKPGGLAYISEPVFAGTFNEIMRLFNDEQKVREAAFAALERATESGLFELREEVFFEAPSTYPDFRTFVDRTINVTYAAHQLDEGLYNEVRNRFMAQMTEQGARFLKPIRVDVLRRPG
jgi:SAM-dependent methyltransferase